MLKRLVSAVGVLLTVSVLIFLAMRVVPGDPVTVLTAGAEVSEQTKADLRKEYNLDDPLPLQYVRWVGDAVQGDLGQSLKSQAGVGSLIGKSLPITLLVILGGPLVSLLLSLPPATFAAYRDHGKPAIRIREAMQRADAVLGELKARGIDLDQVTQTVEAEGVKSFAASFDSLLKVIEQKAAVLV